MSLDTIYEAHHERVREAMTAQGLDPDNPDDKSRMPRGAWFSLQDQTRLDLTTEAGFNDELGSRRRAVPVPELITNFLKTRVGGLVTLATICDGVGCSRTSLRRWIDDNPGVLVQTPIHGVFSVSNAARADELADMEASITTLMGH